jgi:hypothetical protein
LRAERWRASKGGWVEGLALVVRATSGGSTAGWGRRGRERGWRRVHEGIRRRQDLLEEGGGRVDSEEVEKNGRVGGRSVNLSGERESGGVELGEVAGEADLGDVGEKGVNEGRARPGHDLPQ